MTTPRKTPARKASPRTAQPKTVAAKVSAFAALRARAGDRELGVRAATTPYEIPGFEPPITVTWPTLLSEEVALEIASRNGDVIGYLHTLLGDVDFVRVLARFEQEPDGKKLLVGLQLAISDHFLGRGAGDVPGGTPASSTS